MKEKSIQTKYGKIVYKVSETNYHDTICLLHGFGMEMSTFDNLISKLKNVNIIVIDFLGFGKSSEPLFPLSIDDYVESINMILSNVNNLYLLGHSFGGRIAIKYSEKYKVKKVFLVNAKAFKNKNLLFRLKIIKYKIVKIILYLVNKNKFNEYIKNKGSSDYINLSDCMKKTFVRIVNEDLKTSLKKIENEVVVMGSINDSIVDYKETLKIYKFLKKGKLYPFYFSNHFSYIEEETKVLNIIYDEMIS